MKKVMFRIAERSDCILILKFIKELAAYENLLDEVTATEELLEKWLFDMKKAEVLFVLEEEKEVGFAIYFNNFSTFLGKPGIYLEDLYVMPEYRGKGYGKALLKKLAQIAKENDFGRVEWCCLDWNKSSIDFYRSLNAQPMSEWTTYRITNSALDDLAE